MVDAEITRRRVLDAVAADFRPVRPIRAPVARAMALVPLTLLMAALAVGRYNGENLHQLGPVMAWGLSSAQWVLGMIVLAVAFREATPGSQLPRRSMVLGALLVAGLIAFTTLVTYAAHPAYLPAGREALISYLCFIGSLKLGLPVVLLSAFLAARAFPTTPARVGALCGLAAGVMTDSGWRLTCWITAPSHVVSAHLLAVVTLMACGALLGVIFDRLNARRS